MIDRIIAWCAEKIGLGVAANIAVLGVFVFGAWLGWTLSGWLWVASYAELEKTHAEAEAVRDRAVLEALEQVRALERQGDAIAARLMTAEAARTQLAKEKDDAIRAYTTGKPCLAAGLVGLLNNTTGSGSGLRLSAPASGLAPADSAAATDTDVALWARVARDAHDACRARIDALNDFYDGVPK